MEFLKEENVQVLGMDSTAHPQGGPGMFFHDPRVGGGAVHLEGLKKFRKNFLFLDFPC